MNYSVTTLRLNPKVWGYMREREREGGMLNLDSYRNLRDRNPGCPNTRVTDKVLEHLNN